VAEPAVDRSAFALDPDVTFLNHGSFGATPTSILERQAELRARMEANPVRFFVRELPGLLADAREQVAAYVGADADGIAFVANTTTAINVVARSLRLEAGDEILLDNHEYGAMRLLWDEVARESGARVVVVELPIPYTDERQIVDAFAAAVTARTRVVFFSHITSLSSYMLPARRLVELAHDAGALAIVDGAHAPGQVALDLDRVGADLYAGNFHKWLCAPKGSAFLYANAASRRWVCGEVVSWGWTWEGDDAYLHRFDWGGTRDPSAILCVPACIELQRGWEDAKRDAHALTVTAADALEPHAARIAADGRRAPQMVTLALRTSRAPEELWSDLWQEHRIEIPVERLATLTITRVSAQVYTSAADVDALVAAFDHLLT
jgi:isopenicillin-N epimerase